MTATQTAWLHRLPHPVEAWRYEWIDGTTLRNYPPGHTTATARCTNPRRPHTAPISGDCSCGFRAVPELPKLSAYLEHQLRIRSITGVDPEGDFLDAVVTRVEATGLSYPGMPPPEDPHHTLRVSDIRLLEVYAADYIDTAALAERYQVPVRPLYMLGPSLFRTLRTGPRRPTRNRIEVDPTGNYWTFYLGPYTFTLPGEVLLTGTRCARDVWALVLAVLDYGANYLQPGEHHPGWRRFARDADALWERLQLDQAVTRRITPADRWALIRGTAWLIYSAANYRATQSKPCRTTP